MKHENLRVGNIIYTTDKGETVATINDIINNYTGDEQTVGVVLTDEWFIKLGFYKALSHKKRKPGISNKVWRLNDNFQLTIEKHHVGIYDEGQTFYPTLRLENINSIIVFKHVHHLQNVVYELTRYKI